MTDLIFINPETKITIKGKDYTAKGTVHFINALQKHFNLHFARIAERLDKGEMLLEDLAEIIRHGIEGGTESVPSTDDIEEYIVESVGLANAPYLLSAFMQACVMPEGERGKYLANYRKNIEKINVIEENGTLLESLSENTAVSA